MHPLSVNQENKKYSNYSLTALRLTRADANLPSVRCQLRGKHGSGCPIANGVDELMRTVFEGWCVQFDREDESAGLNRILNAHDLRQNFWRSEIDVAEQQSDVLGQGGEIDPTCGGPPMIEAQALSFGQLQNAGVHFGCIDAEDVHTALEERISGPTRRTADVERSLAAQIELFPTAPCERLLELQPRA